MTWNLMEQYHKDLRDVSSGVTGVYEFRFVNRYGEIRNCLNNVGVIPGTDQSIASVVDITVLKQAEIALRQTLDQLTHNEQDLRESEEKYRTVFENTGTATVVLTKTVRSNLPITGLHNSAVFPRKRSKERRAGLNL